MDVKDNASGAISPRRAFAGYQISDEGKESIDLLQEHIDNLLDEGYISMRWLKMTGEDIQLTKGITVSVGMMTELRRRYKAAGWTLVEFSYSGTSIRLS